MTSSPPRRHVVGMPNLGSSCFMNATLQCVTNTPGQFVSDWIHLLDILPSSSRNTSSGMLSWRFAEFLHDYASDRTDMSASLHALRQALAAQEKQFTAAGQHDAYEFLGCLLDGLEEDCKRLPLGQAGIHKCLGVKTYTTRQCQTCKQKNNVDHVTDTVLRVPLVTDAAHADERLRLQEEAHEVPLKDLLLNLQKEEVIEGYDCDYCRAQAQQLGRAPKRSVVVQKAYMLSDTSDILVLALFRFINTCDHYGRVGAVKVRRKVRIPPDLHLGTGIYSLYGLVSHIGSSVSHGHYVAAVKDTVSQEWCYCDDASTSPLPAAPGQVPAVPGDPFILFFHRTSNVHAAAPKPAPPQPTQPAQDTRYAPLRQPTGLLPPRTSATLPAAGGRRTEPPYHHSQGDRFGGAGLPDTRTPSLASPFASPSQLTAPLAWPPSSTHQAYDRGAQLPRQRGDLPLPGYESTYAHSSIAQSSCMGGPLHPSLRPGQYKSPKAPTPPMPWR